MEIGLGRLLEMFEDRFGRFPTTILILLIAGAVAGFSIHIMWVYIVTPIYEFSQYNVAFYFGRMTAGNDIAELLASSSITALFVLGFISIVVILLPLIVNLVRKRAVSQSSLDRLAQFRAEAINTLFATKPNNDVEFVDWQVRYRTWEKEVKVFLKSRFPLADYLAFENLGIIGFNINPVHAQVIHNLEHGRLMTFLATQITIIEDILRNYRKR